MTLSQKLALRASEIRKRLAEIAALEGDALTDEVRSEMTTLRNEMQDVELRYQSAVTAEDEPETRTTTTDTTGEGNELAEIRSRVQDDGGICLYAGVAIERRALDGAALELNQALQIPADRFPLELLAPDVEVRATTNTDAAAVQQTWVDRLFSDTHAMRLGMSFQSVAPGVAAYPVTTGGAAAAQRGRSEAAADAAWTVGVSELKPTRNTVRVVFNEEDSYRLPGLEPALRRDLAMALAEGVDRVVFLGDAGANENTADIAGLNTAANVVEVTLTQANKVKGPATLAAFIGLVDGKHASMESDLAICASVGANTLWASNLVDSTADSVTVAQFLRAAGLSWIVRGDIDTNTAANDWGAFVGRQRGISGAGVVPVWNSGKLIRDEYSGSAKGEIAVTLATYWNFGLPRPSNFARLKFVA